MHDHWWWRPGWSVGTRFYTWHITLEGQDDVHRLVDDYQRALARFDTLDVIPRQWRHMTMHGIGHQAEVSDSDLDRVISATTDRLRSFRPIDVTFDRAVIFKEAVALRPDQPQQLSTLRDQLRAAMAELSSDGRIPEQVEGFRPHISIAYSNADADGEPIRRALDAAPAEPATLRLTHVSLIRLHRDHRIYEWQTVAHVPRRSA